MVNGKQIRIFELTWKNHSQKEYKIMFSGAFGQLFVQGPTKSRRTFAKSIWHTVYKKKKIMTTAEFC